LRESILIVDDEAGVRGSLAGILGDEGYAPEAVDSGEACLALLEARRFDLILLDVWLPKMDGLETLSRIRALDAEVPVVVISGHGNIETAVKAVRMGAQDFVEKPLALEKILLVVKNALRQRRLEAENRALKEKVEHRWVMVGESAAIHALRADIAQAAPSNGRVLIFGENGTGKELVARNIHHQSRRASGPFVEVNCAAIPEELIESELFGHTRGAFTGALTAKKGKFELADGGTLFLDEVGDMTLKTQAKVLRVLQEQKVEPVGGTTSVTVDVRVIAATNKNLEEEIRRGTFREDLFFRLNVVSIKLPPLRERKQDIPRLVEAFLREFNIEHEKYITGISRGAMDLLMQYHWPGNVRELKNTIEGMMVLSASGRLLDVSDLPEHILRQVELKTPAADIHVRVGMTMEEIEKIAIEHTLRSVGYDKQKAAEILGIGLRTLYRKQKRYQLG
jgi:two-component system, NtrC family, nitrogen regulation response regulator NtrX